VRLLFSFCGAAPFQFAHGCFQRVQLLAGLQQHGALHFEFLASDQVELGQAGLQRALEGGLQFLARFAQTRRHQVAQYLKSNVPPIEIGALPARAGSALRVSSLHINGNVEPVWPRFSLARSRCDK
jgi:hypothetical protein